MILLICKFLQYFYVKKGQTIDEEEDTVKMSKDDPRYFLNLKSMNSETRETLAQLAKDYQPAEKAGPAPKADAVSF